MGAGAEIPPILQNLVLFARLLRRLGLPATPARVVDLVDALKMVGLSSRADVKSAARAVLVSRREHVELFNVVFDLFWKAAEDHPQLDLGMLLQKVTEVVRRQGLQLSDSEAGSEAAESDEEERRRIPAYSNTERLRHKDFADLNGEELEQVDQILRGMTWKFELRRTRRRIPEKGGPYLDGRRTLRHSLRHGGEVLQLMRKAPKEKRRDLVVICDISGSMELYSRIFLQFIHILRSGLKQTEAFVFGTRLTRITHHLEQRDLNEALRLVTASIQDWAGGTRIGEALKSFNYEWGRRVLSQGAVVLIISDGWDRGEIDLLAREMARLQRSCRRLVWLNPLLGSPRYQPISRGIQAALPHIDDFLPVHNLVSLQQLGDFLDKLESQGRGSIKRRRYA